MLHSFHLRIFSGYGFGENMIYLFASADGIRLAFYQVVQCINVFMRECVRGANDTIYPFPAIFPSQLAVCFPHLSKNILVFHAFDQCNKYTMTNIRCYF